MSDTLSRRPVPLQTDAETPAFEASSVSRRDRSVPAYGKYLLAGIFFGILLVKAEVISWFRIQEMFRLESFHLYGVIGSAVATGALSVLLLKKFRIKTLSGDPIVIPRRIFHRGQIFGGLCFGFGWALTGACPGPLFAQIGAGFGVVVVTLLSAVAGTWVYGAVRDRLPH